MKNHMLELGEAYLSVAKMEVSKTFEKCTKFQTYKIITKFLRNEELIE